jgi:RNA polymerase sigma factor (sigma-70 family)
VEAEDSTRVEAAIYLMSSQNDIGKRAELARLAKTDLAPLYSYLCRATGDRSQADDILQDALMDASKSLGSFDPEKGSMRAWLFRIGQNRLRKSMRRQRIEWESTEHVEPNAAPATPLELMESRLQSERLEAAIASLSPIAREVVLLR